MFDINITTIIQFVNFAVTLLMLDFLLIRPVRAIVKKRRDLAGAMIHDAQAFIDNANEKLASYEYALAKAREEAAAVREECKQQAANQEAELLQQAQADAQGFLKASREDVHSAVADAMHEMHKRTPDLAKLAAARLLGKKAA